jgi:hypothetical protein
MLRIFPLGSMWEDNWNASEMHSGAFWTYRRLTGSYSKTGIREVTRVRSRREARPISVLVRACERFTPLGVGDIEVDVMPPEPRGAPSKSPQSVH